VLMQDSLQLDELRTLHRLFKVILQPEHRLIRAFSHAFPELRKSFIHEFNNRIYNQIGSSAHQCFRRGMEIRCKSNCGSKFNFISF
jgi:hypothetical protein